MNLLSRIIKVSNGSKEKEENLTPMWEMGGLKKRFSFILQYYVDYTYNVWNVQKFYYTFQKLEVGKAKWVKPNIWSVFEGFLYYYTLYRYLITTLRGWRLITTFASALMCSAWLWLIVVDNRYLQTWHFGIFRGRVYLGGNYNNFKSHRDRAGTEGVIEITLETG